MERHRIGIVIPTLNESTTITDVVSSTSQYGLPIVVDDGSIDGSGHLAKIAGAKVVRHETNKGYDQALNTGFAYANELGCEYVITMDGDGQHDKSILPSFIQALDAGSDMVVGIRDRRQRLAEHIFAWVGSAKWGIKDPLCGMKAYHIGIYKMLGHFDAYGSIGTELVIYAAKSGCNIVQLPINTRDRSDEPRFGKRYSANMQILRALWLSLKNH